jgi:predicted kinase
LLAAKRTAIHLWEAGAGRTVSGMAGLILINGAPGIGKSTLARRYAEDHPLTLVLDIDRVRGMLGRWLEMPTESGALARSIAIEMACVHLRDGYDVVVPQFLSRMEFVLSLQQLCERSHAEFVEVALLSSPEDAMRRFTRRTDASASAEHRDAAELLERSGGTGELRNMYNRLMEVIAARPATHTVICDGQVERAYLDLLAAISA